MPPEGNPPAEQPREPAAQPPAERAPSATPDTTPRASDAERNQAIDRLRAAYVEGRLDQEEFDERSSSALKARTIGQLERLFDDLPTSYHGTPVYHAHAGAPVVRPGPGGNRLSIGIMSGVDRKGPWRVPPDSTAFALMGGVQLDLRGAILSAQVTTITAVAIMGGIEIIVPPGIRVESSGFGFMGGWDNRARNDLLGPDSPVLRVRGVAFMGGVDIRTKELPDSPGRRPIEGSA